MYFDDEEERRRRQQEQEENLSFHDEFKQNLQKAGLLGEEKVMTGPLGNITYYDEPQRRQQTELPARQQFETPVPSAFKEANKQPQEIEQSQNEPMSFAQKAMGLGKVAASGVTLNTMDELAGAAGGIINAGRGMLPGSANYNQSFADNFKTGYQIARDDWRNDVAAAKREMPVLANTVENVASAVSPLGVVKAGASAPLVIKSAKNMQSAINAGIINGWGSTEENTAQEYAKNIGGSITSNVAGHLGANNALGRAGDPLTRTTISGLISDLTNAGYQHFLPVKTKTPEEYEEERRRRMLGYY